MIKNGLLIAGMLVASTALAQDPEGYLTISWNNLVDSATANATSESGFSIGYGQRLQRRMNSRGVPSVEFKWTRWGSGDRLDVFSVMYVERFMQPNQDFYFGLGGGVNYKTIDVGGVSDNNFGFTAIGLVGYQLSENTMLEGSYTFAGDVAGMESNFWSITFGFKF